MPTTFNRVSDSTADDWTVIARAVAAGQRQVPSHVLEMLASLEHVTDEFPVNQLQHALQTADLARAAGADDEVVVAALCHDIGKAVSVPGHGDIAAAILRPYVREDVSWVVSVHELYQGAHFFHHLGIDPNLRRNYESHPAHGLAVQFVDEWDERAFDAERPTSNLGDYEQLVTSVFTNPRRRT
jgi:predicted HD phosphohydrolase